MDLMLEAQSGTNEPSDGTSAGVLTEQGSEFADLDVVIDGRPCRLIISNASSGLTLSASQPTNLPALVNVLADGRDLAVYARWLTIDGAISLPGQRVAIGAKRITVAAPGASISVVPHGQIAAGPPPGGGVPAGTAPTTPGQMGEIQNSELATSWDAFIAGGGAITNLIPGDTTPDSDMISWVISWSWPTGSPWPGNFMPSGLSGAQATIPGIQGTGTAVAAGFSIRIVAENADLAGDLTFDASGGTGGAGQSGQAGGNGLDGPRVDYPYTTGADYPMPYWGGLGGDGGDATRGGAGGNAGAIVVAVQNPLVGNGQIVAAAVGGHPGPDGTPGAAGAGGVGSFLHWQGTFDVQFPRNRAGRQGGFVNTPPQAAGADGPVTRRAPTDDESLAVAFALRALERSSYLANSVISSLRLGP